MIDWVLSAKNLILGRIVAIETDYETCCLHSHRVPDFLGWLLPTNPDSQEVFPGKQSFLCVKTTDSNTPTNVFIFLTVLTINAKCMCLL